MKKLGLTFVLVLVAIYSVNAQKKVRERDVEGEWKMVIDLDREEFEEDWDEESEFGRFIAESVTDFVYDIIDEIDIYFEFQSHNRVRVTAGAFGEREVKYTDWHINQDGELIIGEVDDFDIDIGEQEDDIWMLEDGVLLSYDKGDHGELDYNNVYLVRVD